MQKICHFKVIQNHTIQWTTCHVNKLLDDAAITRDSFLDVDAIPLLVSLILISLFLCLFLPFEILLGLPLSIRFINILSVFFSLLLFSHVILNARSLQYFVSFIQLLMLLRSRVFLVLNLVRNQLEYCLHVCLGHSASSVQPP